MNNWVKRVLSVILTSILVGGALPLVSVSTIAAGGNAPPTSIDVSITDRTR